MVKKVIVIGAGFTGLSTAYYLSKLNYEVCIYEASDSIGGLGAPFQFGTHFLEKSYHAFFKGDKNLINLIEELGLKNEITYGELKLGFINSEGIFPFGSPIDIIKNKQLNLISKIKLGIISYKMAKIKNWQKLDSIYAKDWLIKHGTKQLWDKLFKPLFDIKWSNNSEKISAAWIWGRINPRATSREKSGKESLFTLKNSSKVIIEKMKEYIENKGCSIHFNSMVSKIKYKNEKVFEIIINESTKINSFDYVVSTISPKILIKTIEGYSYNSPTYFDQIEYMDNICLVLSTKNNLIDLGQIPVSLPEVNFGGIINWTSLTGTQMYDGQHIYYIFSYVDKNDKLFQKDENHIKNVYFNDLRKVLPNFCIEDINWVKVFKLKNATPIFNKNYLEKVPPIESEYKNLFMGGMFNIYPITDYNNCIRISKEIINKIIINDK